jgi:hypothetical protein
MVVLLLAETGLAPRFETEAVMAVVGLPTGVSSCRWPIILEHE